MYTKTSPESAIDSVVVAEGTFKIINPAQEPRNPDIDLVLVYVNKETGKTFGTCPGRNAMFSMETMEKLEEFLRSAEEDFGSVVFGTGMINPGRAQMPERAESGKGLSIPGLGGRDGGW